MKEGLNWFGQNREKQKLMSEVVEIASNAVDSLRGSNFTYIDPHGDMRIKKEFTWTEFTPKGQANKKLLERGDVLEALGIGPAPKIEDAPKGRDKGLPNHEIKGIWPTVIPGLYYVRVRSLDTMLEDDYFSIDEVANGEAKPQDLTEKETNSAWNKKMWDQENVDQKAGKELDELGDRYPDLPKD